MSSIQNEVKKIGTILQTLLTTIDEFVDLIRRRKFDEDTSRYLQDLNPSLSYRDTKDLVLNRVEGTCEWFFAQDAYKKWIKAPGGSLLISADPGCGKSVLAKYLIDEELPRKWKSSSICYYFFKDVVQDRLAPALCALLHQLFSANRSLLKCALPTLEANGKAITNNASLLLDLLWQTGRDSWVGPIIIVIDALDECNGEDRGRLLRFLERIQSSEEVKDKIKILMTTRPYDIILSKYTKDVRSNRLHVPGERESDAIGREIDLVIKHRLGLLYKKKRLSPELRSELEDKLLSEKNRTYLWVYFLFEELENSLKRTDKEIRRLFKSLPRNINEAYEKMLKKLDNEDTRQIVFHILCAILSAGDSLTIQQIQCVAKIGLSPRMTSHDELDLEPAEDFAIKMQNWCGLFVRIYQGRVVLIHQTAREFLVAEFVLSKTSNFQWHGSIPIKKAHQTMAQLCVVYLWLCRPSIQQQQDIASLELQDMWNLGGTFPFLDYAANWWEIHLDKGCFAADDDFLDQASLMRNPKNTMFRIWFSTRFKFSKFQRFKANGWLLRYPVTDLAAAALLQSSILPEFLLAKRHHELGSYELAEAFEFACLGHPDNFRILMECSSTEETVLYEYPLRAVFVLNRLDIAQQLLVKSDADENLKLSPIGRRNTILFGLLFSDVKEQVAE